MNHIEHIIEPERLVLAWQSPSDEDRKRRVVGELLRQDNNVLLNYFVNSDDFQKATEAGFSGYPAFKVSHKQFTDRVIDILARRLPPRSRSDFDDYLRKFRLFDDVDLSDFALLGYTEARLPGDGFSIVNDYANAVPPFEFVTELAGFRFYDGMQMKVRDVVGRRVEFVPEPENKHDENAVCVGVDGQKLGYINRIQAPSFLSWLGKHEVEGSIDRCEVSGDVPRGYIFVKVLPKVGK